MNLNAESDSTEPNGGFFFNFLSGIHGRGLVVSIRIDPTEPIVTEEVLLRFQRSVFGPIIEP